MRTLMTRLNRHRSELLVSGLRIMTYLGLAALFLLLMGIPDRPLRTVRRTSDATLLTWAAMTFAMTNVYGGYDVGRKKSRPITSSMALGNLITCLVTYLQLRIMSASPGDRTDFRLIGPDFPWLILCAALQTVFLYGMVRAGSGT